MHESIPLTIGSIPKGEDSRVSYEEGENVVSGHDTHRVGKAAKKSRETRLGIIKPTQSGVNSRGEKQGQSRKHNEEL